jgi:hypothetical protein
VDLAISISDWTDWADRIWFHFFIAPNIPNRGNSPLSQQQMRYSQLLSYFLSTMFVVVFTFISGFVEVSLGFIA